MSDVNTKKILDVTLVFEQEFGRKTFAQIIDGRVIVGEKETIIGVKDDYAIFSNEETRVNLRFEPQDWRTCGNSPAQRQSGRAKKQIPAVVQ